MCVCVCVDEQMSVRKCERMCVRIKVNNRVTIKRVSKELEFGCVRMYAK